MRARNRRILLEKIAKMGLTEDEYNEKKKKEKQEREKARRRKVAQKKKEEKERLLKEKQQNKKKQDKVSTEEKIKKRKKDIKTRIAQEIIAENLPDTAPVTNIAVDTVEKTKTTTIKTTVTTTIAKKQPKSTTNKKSLPQSSKSKPQLKVISSSETSGKSSAGTNSILKPEIVFSREFKWSHHPFDDDFQSSLSASSDVNSPNEQKSSSKTATSSAPSTTAHKKGVNNVLKRKKCKNGGPGGLICCSECNALYSRYLVFTHREMERIAVQKVSQEVSELIVLLEESRNRLKDSFERVDNNRDRRFDFLDASSFYLTENNNPNKIGRRRGTSIGSCGGGLFHPHHLELDMSNAMDAYNSGG